MLSFSNRLTSLQTSLNHYVMMTLLGVCDASESQTTGVQTLSLMMTLGPGSQVFTSQSGSEDEVIGDAHRWLGWWWWWLEWLEL